MKHEQDIYRITDIHPRSAWYKDAHWIVGVKGTIANLWPADGLVGSYMISSLRVRLEGLPKDDSLNGWSYFQFYPKTRRRPRKKGSNEFFAIDLITFGLAKFEKTTWRGIYKR